MKRLGALFVISLTTGILGYFISTSCMEASEKDIFSSILGLIPTIFISFYTPFAFPEENTQRKLSIVGDDDMDKSLKWSVGLGFLSSLGAVFFNLFYTTTLKAMIFAFIGFLLALVVAFIGLEHKNAKF